MESKFLKVGNKIMCKPVTDGLDYELESGTVYTIDIDRYTDEIEFKIAPQLQMPFTLYSTETDTKFINKVLNYYKSTTDSTVGVMLSGLKGSGKTVMMKQIALQSKLPIILIDKSFHPSQLVKLFNLISNTEVCVLMDEVDKLGDDYDDNYLLRILDGINSSGKKLMIFTCNDEEGINEYLVDRCSRIRYWRRFDYMQPSMISNILTDKLKDKDEVNVLTDFIVNNFDCISFDNVVSFVTEVNNNPDDTFEELFEDMNLSKKE